MGEAIREILKGIKEMPNFLLFFLISISLTSMYWFISIFLFHKSFYLINPLGISILFSIALAITWFLLYLFLSGLTIANRKKQLNGNSAEMLSFVSGFSSLLYLLIIIGAFYIYRNYNSNATYYLFLKWAFIYTIGITIKAAIIFAKNLVAEAKRKDIESKKEEAKLKGEFESMLKELKKD